MAAQDVQQLTEKGTIDITGFVASDGVTPASVDGPPTGASSDAAIATVVMSPDGMHADILGVDFPAGTPPNVVTVTLQADANKDPNVANFITFVQDFIMHYEPAPEPVAAAFVVKVGAAPK